jgi:magnesium chelatase subunit I
VYEGEQEGPYNVALHLIFKGIKSLFLEQFPNPNQKIKRELKDEYGVIKAYFSGGNNLELLNDDANKTFEKKLENVAGLRKIAENYMKHDDDITPLMDLIVFGLAECEVLGKNILENSLEFGDPLSDMLNDLDN